MEVGDSDDGSGDCQTASASFHTYCTGATLSRFASHGIMCAPIAFTTGSTHPIAAAFLG
jgi:hypothetical protein